MGGTRTSVTCALVMGMVTTRAVCVSVGERKAHLGLQSWAGAGLELRHLRLVLGELLRREQRLHREEVPLQLRVSRAPPPASVSKKKREAASQARASRHSWWFTTRPASKNTCPREGRARRRGVEPSHLKELTSPSQGSAAHSLAIRSLRVRWEGTGRAWVGWVGGRTDRVSERRHGQPRHGHVVHRVQLIELVLRTAPPHTLTPSMPLKPGLSASGNPIVLSSPVSHWMGWLGQRCGEGVDMSVPNHSAVVRLLGLQQG